MFKTPTPIDSSAGTAPAEPTYYATRDFQDVGTERQFAGRKPITEASAGEIANYVAAGLATTEEPKPAAAA